MSHETEKWLRQNFVIHQKETLIVIIWFCSSILDDMEMYEQQNPFKLQDFINMSQFLNMFVYKSIMGQLFGKFLHKIIL